MHKHLKGWLRQSLSQSVSRDWPPGVLETRETLPKPYLMVPKGTQWYPMIADGTWWYPMVPDGTTQEWSPTKDGHPPKVKECSDQKLILRKLLRIPKNLGVDTFPDPVRHFGAPWRPFWILQAMRCCRRWASAPFAARLVFLFWSYIITISTWILMLWRAKLVSGSFNWSDLTSPIYRTK